MCKRMSGRATKPSARAAAPTESTGIPMPGQLGDGSHGHRGSRGSRCSSRTARTDIKTSPDVSFLCMGVVGGYGQHLKAQVLTCCGTTLRSRIHFKSSLYSFVPPSDASSAHIVARCTIAQPDAEHDDMICVLLAGINL